MHNGDNVIISQHTVRVKPITRSKKVYTNAQGRDTFETPNYAVDLLVPFIPKEITTIWECACGSGKISSRLANYGYQVINSDIRDMGINTVENFLYTDYDISPGTAIITNPPYSIKEEFIERAFLYDVPFAFLINSDYHAKHIDWIRRGCEKIIPNRRIDFITPTGRQGRTSASQFHSMWLTYKFGLGCSETFVDLPIEWKKERI